MLPGTWDHHLRFAWRYPRFLRERIDECSAREVIRSRLENRDRNLLAWVRRVVFEGRATPYHALMDHAGVDRGEFSDLVAREGVEGALVRLRAAGVWVSYDEFKGRSPIRRGSCVIETGPGAFDNPLVTAAYGIRTGGSTGRARRVMVDLDELGGRAPNLLLADEVAGLRGAPWAIWFGVLPDSGLNSVLSRVPYGGLPERWFTPISSAYVRPPFAMRLANDLAVRVARLRGVLIPWPEAVPIERAEVVARWLAETVARDGRALLRSYVSLLVRVAQSAQGNGLDLSGAVLSGGGEPPTRAKVEEIERSGARFVPAYHFSEAGPVGVACRYPRDENDLHFLADRLALIQAAHKIGDVQVEAFHFTSLLPSAPKLMLNVESDDYGTVDEQACGCGLDEIGYRRHVRNIRSFGKLTGTGMTLVRDEALRMLEHELPRRFLASGDDFQLQEREVSGGKTVICLVVRPTVHATDDELLDVLRSLLARSSPAAAMADAIWAQGGGLVVEREEPKWTERGKLLPLHIERANESVKGTE